MKLNAIHDARRFYHATKKSLLPNIMREGLLVKYMNSGFSNVWTGTANAAIYLFDTLDSAMIQAGEVYEDGYKVPGAVLSVNLDDLDDSKLLPDDDCPECDWQESIANTGACCYADDIPPNLLRKEWVG